MLPTTEGTVDVEPFLGLQRWLTAAGIRQVAIPFAEVLADYVPATAVRMRRDFRQLLTTIQALAFLHQRQRNRTPEGWVEATLEDYAMARDLLSPVFDALAADTVTPVIRATVEAVNDEEEISATELARRLGLSKSTISYRVSRVLEGGWLVNRETRKGQISRLARGAELPEVVNALPTVAQVRGKFDGSNALGGDDPPPPLPRNATRMATYGRFGEHSRRSPVAGRRHSVRSGARRLSR